MGEQDEVRGEAVAAGVRRLPGPVRVRGGEHRRDRPAAHRAARVVPAVRADQVDGLVGRLGRVLEVGQGGGQRLGRVDAAPADRLVARPAVDHREPAARLGGHAPRGRAPDELEPGLVGAAEGVDPVDDVAGEPRPAEGLGTPRAGVLDEQPATRGRCRREERVLALASGLRTAEGHGRPGGLGQGVRGRHVSVVPAGSAGTPASGCDVGPVESGVTSTPSVSSRRATTAASPGSSSATSPRRTSGPPSSAVSGSRGGRRQFQGPVGELEAQRGAVGGRRQDAVAQSLPQAQPRSPGRGRARPRPGAAAAATRAGCPSRPGRGAGGRRARHGRRRGTGRRSARRRGGRPPRGAGRGRPGRTRRRPAAGTRAAPGRRPGPRAASPTGRGGSRRGPRR